MVRADWIRWRLSASAFSEREVGGNYTLTGISRILKAALVNTPELREMRSQTMLFVFGLQERDSFS